MLQINEVSQQTIELFYNIQSQGCTSFSALHSVSGYSKTEWGIEQQQATSFKEFVVQNGDHVLAMIRLKSMDYINQSAERLNTSEYISIYISE